MKNKKISIWGIGFIVSFGLSWLGNYVAHNFIDREVIQKLYHQTFVEYFWLFYIGMFLAEFKDKVLPVLKRFWCVLLLIGFLFFWISCDLFSGYYLFWSLFLTTSLIGFAYRYPEFSINPDISYGLFLYHMTVVNMFVNYGWKGSWLYVIPVVIGATTLAYISTITIGKWSAERKRVMVE